MLTIGHTLHVPWLSLSVCTWSLLYFTLRRLEPQQKAEWHCRVVTVIHASLITLLSGWSAFVEGPWPFTDAGGPNTPLQVVVVTICVGYFLFDFSWCLYFQTEGFPMLLHHFLSIFGMFFMLVSGNYGTEMVATIFGSELTNPLLQLRWFLRETGHYKTLAGEVVNFLFMTSFFFLRIVVGSVLLYCYFQQPTDFWGRLGAICIYLIGWMFWVSIFQYAVYKHGKKFRAWCDWVRMGKSSRLNHQSRDDEDENDKSLKGGQNDSDSAPSGRLSRNSVERPGQSLSSGVLQNGTFHRNNGGPSSSKGTAHLNGSSEKYAEQR